MKVFWTKEELDILKDCYKHQATATEIQEKIPNHTVGASMTKASELGLTKRYIKKNNAQYKADYQNYDWCYDKFIVQGKTLQQIADETGYGLRVLEKWMYEKHHISNKTYRKLARLTPIQYSIILAGTLGDGHIDKREKYAIYIESHADNQKDYLFWKYDILRNLCLSEPKRYNAATRTFNNRQYFCQGGYRIETRAIDELKIIRDKTISERIEELDELGFCTHMLDDAYRSGDSWIICLGDWTQDEIEKYITVVYTKFNFFPKQQKDKRYVRFCSEESNIIDTIILSHIPNDLDIIQDKIIKRQRFGVIY